MECSQNDMSHYYIVKELVHDVVAHFSVYDIVALIADGTENRGGTLLLCPNWYTFRLTSRGTLSSISDARNDTLPVGISVLTTPLKTTIKAYV